MDIASAIVGKSIIIVDDSKKIQIELSAAFSSLGLQVVGIANHGEEAIKLYQDRKPDLVSMDIVMPVMHGVECYQKLKALDPELKLFFVSCLAHDHSVISALSADLHPYQFVSKPWSETLIIRALELTLFGTQSQESLDFRHPHELKSNFVA